MPKKTKFNERNEDIRLDFKKLTQTKKMKSSAAIEEIASKYYLNEGTVSNIVYAQGRYRVKNIVKQGDQMSIFDHL